MDNCKSCINGTTCESCRTEDIRELNSSTNQCDCLKYYYSVSGQTLCLRCHYSCATCVAPGACSTCDLSFKFREVDPFNTSNKLCVCTAGYYDD